MGYRIRIFDIKIRENYFRPLWLDASTPLERHPCPICGGSDACLALSSIAGGADTSLCRRCEHFYFSKRPSPAWFKNHYETEWVHCDVHETPRLKDRMVEFAWRRYRNYRENGWLAMRSLTLPEQRFELFRKYLPLRGRILEVGAGGGRFLKPFLKRRFSCSAIEPQEASARACQKMGVRIVGSFIEDRLSQDTEAFDFVFSNHSLEHHSNPHLFFQLARRVLPVGGHVGVVVPNHARMFLLTEMMFILHIHSFTEASLARLMAMHGFAVVRKLVDEELTLIGRKLADGEVHSPLLDEPALTEAAAVDRYSHRFVETFGDEKGVLPAGPVLASFSGVRMSPRRVWGGYDVRFTPPGDGAAAIAGDGGKYSRNVLLEIEPRLRQTPLVEIVGPGDGPAPMFVK